MYDLTPRMLQSFRKDLETYHQLFMGGRCSGWELEELRVRAIKSDTQVHHHVIWAEKGHDDKADIIVKTNGAVHPIQIKSGEVKPEKETLVLSGHRLSRFDGDFEKITEYLNGREASTISVPYRTQQSEKHGKVHIYQVMYVSHEVFGGLDPKAWQPTNPKKTSYLQVAPSGVECKITPKMNWQIWWEVPLDLLEKTDEIRID